VQYQNCCSLTQGKSPNCFHSFRFETAHPPIAAAADFGVTRGAVTKDWD